MQIKGEKALLVELACRQLDQAPWNPAALQRSGQLLEEAVELDRQADAATDDVIAVTLRCRSLLSIDRWDGMHDGVPEWALAYRNKQLIEGGVAANRLAFEYRERQDELAVLYWRVGAGLLARLCATTAGQPDWVHERAERQWLEAGIACDRLAEPLIAAEPARALQWFCQGAELLEQLVRNHPRQPEWVGEYRTKFRQHCAQLCARIGSEALATAAGPTVLDSSFCNVSQPMSGLVRWDYLVRSAPGARLRLRLVAPDGGLVDRPLECDDDGLAQGWLGLHTHLLVDGSHAIVAQLHDEAGDLHWSHPVRFSVCNESRLAHRVAMAMEENALPLFIDGPCDASMYPYELAALHPWFDRPDALAAIPGLQGKECLGADAEERLERFVQDGYLVLESAIDDDLIERVNRELDAAAAQGYQGYTPGSSQRLSLLHKDNAAIRSLMFDRRHLDVVDVLFQGRARPCQSLAYMYGSQQDAHQDTIHLTAFPAGYMCGIWIALEDVQEDSGELAIYPGSHRFPRRYMHDSGCAKVKGDWTEFGDKIVRRWESDVAASKIEAMPYRPRKGTVLIWHENLMHLGTVRRNLALTRRSIVFHCFADGTVVYYDSTGEVGMLEETSLPGQAS
jgi:hypothetical protein